MLSCRYVAAVTSNAAGIPQKEKAAQEKAAKLKAVSTACKSHGRAVAAHVVPDACQPLIIGNQDMCSSWCCSRGAAVVQFIVRNLSPGHLDAAGAVASKLMV